jgi:uncharacterized protein DUF6798
VETTTVSSGQKMRRLPVRLFVVVAVFLSFSIDSFARYPVPGPNEPHYLCKAKHYWNPEWCRGDLFLSSSDAHLVFFQTCGLMTRWFSLETTAVVGRLIGLLILAAGWMALVGVLVPGRWQALWAAWIYLALAALGNLSGEWLVGGIEAKVIAYGLLFGAMACWMDGFATGSQRRILLASVLAGLAISFHPVVGIWGTAAAVFATLMQSVATRRDTTRPRVRWTWYLAAAVIVAVLSVPGVIAGLRAAGGSSVVADYIQVYYRLAHHLDPLHFPEWNWIHSRIDGLSSTVGFKTVDFISSAWFAYGVLAVIWLFSRHWMSRHESERWFFWFVIGSALIAAVGFLVGWRSGPPEHVQNYLIPWKWLVYPLRWKILKLYPFRLFDLMLQIAVAITLAGLARRWCERACAVPRGRPRRTVPLIWFLCGIPALLACLSGASDARPQMTPGEFSDWFDACRWIKENTPADAMILTPTQESWAFKWYAERPEYVCYKDCPQDGPGIIEWNNRLLYLADWTEKHLDSGYKAADLAPLRERGVKYIVALRLGPFDFAPVYKNATFRIYRMPDK